MASFAPALLLAPTMMALFASLHAATPEEGRMLTLLGLAFAGVYAAIVCTNYYVQLFVVRLNLINGALEGLALFAMPNLRSAFFALECIGYGFLSLATLTVSPVFVGSGVARWLRLLLIANGVLGIGGMAVALLDRPLLIFAGLGLWNVIFPAATCLLALYFHGRRAAPQYAVRPSPA
ncbi:MAG TPA: hypothetical protein VNK95_13315 [Caldilineaceae bacterium]|nr:hypothetical protein [Caldilineaceae bacterium]